MKLYYSKGACSLAVRIIINEIGVPCEYESVDLKAKKTEKGSDFTKITAKGAVPTLETDDGKILTENAVILQYLADTSKAYELLPMIGDFKRYRVLEWLNFVGTELHKSCGMLFKPNLTPEMRDQVILPWLKAKLAFINQNLTTNKFLLGDTFTLPDAYLFVILTWVHHFKIDTTEWPELKRFFGDVMQRQAVQKSLKEEGLA